MPSNYDVAVVGLGAMGSAAAYHLGRRGKKVVGFDRFTPPHSLGSSHGESRIIREAYFEDPLYVPFVQRSYEGWRELEKDSGKTLLIPTGGLLLGDPGGLLIVGTRLSADRFRLPYDMLSADEIRKRYPIFRVQSGTVGFWEPRAGILLPDRCVEAYLELAEKSGVDLRLGEPVVDWKSTGGGLAVSTNSGVYEAGHVVLAAGSWMKRMLADVNLPLSVERQTLYWFEPKRRAEHFERGKLPIYAWEFDEGVLFYGFPNLGRGAKIAVHHQGETTDVESIDRTIRPEEIAAMKGLVQLFVPDLDGKLLRAEVCMYTNTPDGNFVIDFHPDCRELLIVSACSGHGFKFAAAIGEIVAELLTDGESRFDLSPFRMDRFASPEP